MEQCGDQKHSGKERWLKAKENERKIEEKDQKERRIAFENIN